MTPLVDSHCHIDLYPDPTALISEASRNGWHLIAVTNAPSVFEHTLALTAPHTTVHAALGLHPQLVAVRSQERHMLMKLLPKTRFVGEIGLDYQTKDEEDRELQRAVFTEVVEACSRLGDRILTIHSRRSSKDVLAILGESFRGTAILHYFSGLKGEVDIAAARGFFFSVNPAMVRSKSGRDLIARMNPDLVLTETDGPFVKFGKRPVEPKDITVVIDHLAKTWTCSTDVAAERVFANFERALGQITTHNNV